MANGNLFILQELEKYCLLHNRRMWMMFLKNSIGFIEESVILVIK